MITTGKNLIMLHASAENSTDIITQLCDKLKAAGCIGDKYCSEVIAREEQYPTGLPSEGVTVAIPHAFSDDVMKTAVAVAVLDKPVIFRDISDYDEELEVSMVFLLSNSAGGGEHMDSLQELMDCMSRPALLVDVFNAPDEETVVDILSHTERYPED